MYAIKGGDSFETMRLVIMLMLISCHNVHANRHICSDLLAWRFSKSKDFLRLASRQIQDQAIICRPHLVNASRPLTLAAVFGLLEEKMLELNINYVHIGRHASTNVESVNLPCEEWRGLPTIQAQLRSLAGVEGRYTLLIDISEIGPEILRDDAESRKFWRRIQSIAGREHVIRPAALILGAAETSLLADLKSIREADSQWPYHSNLLQGLRFRLVDLN